MIERVIFLDDIDPVVLFGPNNRLLDQIQSYFPKIKLVARGSELKCMGEAVEVAVFAEKLTELLDYYNKYNRLEEGDLERLLLDADHMRTASGGEFEDALVIGNTGKPVRARTVNQLQLVNEYNTNDLINCRGTCWHR